MQRKEMKRYPVAVYVDEEEWKELELFFLSHPTLRKGQTFKKWIMDPIHKINNGQLDQAAEYQLLIGECK